MDKLVYIANIRLPTEKAHGIQIIEMCSAFADKGIEVDLVVPRRFTPIHEDAFVYHNVKRNFCIKKLPCIDASRFYRPGFIIQGLTFNISVFFYALFNRKALFYTRHEITASWLSLLGLSVIWEGHQGERNLFVNLLIKMGVRMVMISQGLKDLYVSLGAEPDNILVSPDAVDLEKFAIKLSKKKARDASGFGSEKIVLYTGHLYGWKGASTLAEAARFLPLEVIICFMGGTEWDLVSFKEKYAHIPNVKIFGKKSHKDMPMYIRSADLLVIPNSDKELISRLYTSPLKLFEYMASGRPIIASRLPSICEILNESMGYFFSPDDPRDLARVIIEALDNPSIAEMKAEKAFEHVKNYSWQERAKNILDFAGIQAK